MPFVKRVNTRQAEHALAELRATGDEHERAREQLEAIAKRRDDQIRAASELGATRRDVADAARVTPAWVQRVVQRQRDDM